MTELWTLKYRPRRFSDMVGQEAAASVLEKMVENDSVPEGIILSGSRGGGKTTSARILATALNCTAYVPSVGPCLQCSQCLDALSGTSTSVTELDAASNNGAASINQLKAEAMYASVGKFRIFVLDEVHVLSTAAFNALLKILEEPPPQTIFVLVTTEPHKILGTVRSRCMAFEFRRIPPKAIQARLRHIADAEQFSATDDLLKYIADRSEGGMRDAVMTLDQAHRIGITTEAQFREWAGDVDMAPEILKAIVRGDAPSAYARADAALSALGSVGIITSSIASLFKDLLVLKAGGEIVQSGEPLAVRVELAQSLTTPQLLDGMGILWKLKTRVSNSGDPRALLDVGIAVLLSRLSSLKDRPEEPVKPLPAALSAGDLKDLL